MLYFQHSFFLTIVSVSTFGRTVKDFGYLIMTPDFEKYRHYVDGFDLTEERKQELMQTVWSIMESFVDQAWGTHPVQQCRNSADSSLQDSHQILESKDRNPSGEFRHAVPPQVAGQKDSEG